MRPSPPSGGSGHDFGCVARRASFQPFSGCCRPLRSACRRRGRSAGDSARDSGDAPSRSSSERRRMVRPRSCNSTLDAHPPSSICPRVSNTRRRPARFTGLICGNFDSPKAQHMPGHASQSATSRIVRKGIEISTLAGAPPLLDTFRPFGRAAPCFRAPASAAGLPAATLVSFHQVRGPEGQHAPRADRHLFARLGLRPTREVSTAPEGPEGRGSLDLFRLDERVGTSIQAHVPQSCDRFRCATEPIPRGNTAFRTGPFRVSVLFAIMFRPPRLGTGMSEGNLKSI